MAFVPGVCDMLCKKLPIGIAEIGKELPRVGLTLAPDLTILPISKFSGASI